MRKISFTKTFTLLNNGSKHIQSVIMYFIKPISSNLLATQLDVLRERGLPNSPFE